MQSLIQVSTRADATPSMWDKGLVMAISLNLRRIRSSDEIIIAHSGRQHRRGMVVFCIALDPIGAMVRIASRDKSKLGNFPKAHLPVRRHTNWVLGCPSAVRRFRVDVAQVEWGGWV